MPVDTRSPRETVSPALDAERWAGTPLATAHWLEGPTGLPPGALAASAPGADTLVVTAVRGYRLTRRQVDQVVAFTELLAGVALDPGERDELEDDIEDAFEEAPKAAIGLLRPLAGAVARLASLTPAERAQRRLTALSTSYGIEQRRGAEGAEPNPIMAVVGRHNPLVRYWPTTGVALVADALGSRADLHRLVLALIDAEPEPADALAARLVERAADAGPLEAAELAGSQLRLLATRAWLRELGDRALGGLRSDLARAVPSALDVDIVVQQVAYRAALALAAPEPGAAGNFQVP